MANKKKTTKKVIKKITFKEQFKAYNEVCVAGRRYYWQYKKPILYLVKHNGTITYLSDSVIKSHILGDIKEGHVVCLGFSPFVDNQNVLFGGIDFDVHGYTPKQRELELKKLDGNNEELKKQEEIYKQIQRDEIKKDIPAFCNALDEFGYLYFLNNSGSEGQHLRIYSNEPINAKIMQYFLKDLSVKLVGRDDKHEVFPKQTELNEGTPFGNQMKGVLAIHPKTKKLAGIIEKGIVLDREQSLNFLVKFALPILERFIYNPCLIIFNKIKRRLKCNMKEKFKK